MSSKNDTLIDWWLILAVVLGIAAGLMIGFALPYM